MLFSYMHSTSPHGSAGRIRGASRTPPFCGWYYQHPQYDLQVRGRGRLKICG
jgi:hypothetical protein